MEDERNYLLLQLKKHRQEHLIHLYDNTESLQDKTALYDELVSIDFNKLGRLFDLASSKEEKKYESDFLSDIKSVDFEELDCGLQEKVLRIGYEKIFEGKAATLILAAGQGSRLGFEKAKGMYNIGMPSNKSLFEYLCDRHYSASQRAKQYIDTLENSLIHSECPLLIHTSIENNEQTINFFKENNFFGLTPDSVHFFPNTEYIPLLNCNEKKIICKSRTEIESGPNGNGGCLTSMKKSGLIDKLKKLGVEVLHVVAIDNPLSRILDPAYIGYHIMNDYRCSAKFVEKTDPNEAAGVFLSYCNKPMMLEYSDIPKHLSQEREIVGSEEKLKYRACNILNYIIGVTYLDEILSNNQTYNDYDNDYHIATKKVKYFNCESNSSTTIEAYKFEIFLNKIFEFCDHKQFLLFKAERHEEFSPVKNTIGSNTPDQCRRKMSLLFFNWLIKSNIKAVDTNGAEVNPERIVKGEVILELNFRESYDGENITDTTKVLKA